jgi:hypothetical protein
MYWSHVLGRAPPHQKNHKIFQIENLAKNPEKNDAFALIGPNQLALSRVPRTKPNPSPTLLPS